MGSALTWKNVDAPSQVDFTKGTALLNKAISSIGTGLGEISDERSEALTGDYLLDIASKDREELAQLTPDSFQSTFGGDVDSAALAKGLATRQTQLQQQEASALTQEANQFRLDEGIAAKDRRTSNDLFAASIGTDNPLAVSNLDQANYASKQEMLKQQGQANLLKQQASRLALTQAQKAAKAESLEAQQKNVFGVAINKFVENGTDIYKNRDVLQKQLAPYMNPSIFANYFDSFMDKSGRTKERDNTTKKAVARIKANAKGIKGSNFSSASKGIIHTLPDANEGNAVGLGMDATEIVNDAQRFAETNYPNIPASVFKKAMQGAIPETSSVFGMGLIQDDPRPDMEAFKKNMAIEASKYMISNKHVAEALGKDKKYTDIVKLLTTAK